MDDHELWVSRGFCAAIYQTRWCRLWAGHEEPHVAPWLYEFPRQETMVRWNGPDDAPTGVEWLKWEATPLPPNWWTSPPFE